MVEATPDCIVLCDLQGAIVDCNEASCRLLGLPSKDALLGRSAHALLGLPQLTHDSRLRPLDPGVVLPADYEIEGPEGPRVVEISSGLVRTEAGTPSGFVVVARDVTSRRRAELEAERKTQALRSVNTLAIQLAAAAPGADLLSLISDKLREATGAMAAGLSTYDPARGELLIQRVSLDPANRSILVRLLGRGVEGLRCPVSPELHERMLRQVVNTPERVVDLTRGAIPPPIASAIERSLDLGEMTAAALIHGGELVGTVVIAMPREQPSFPTDVMHLLAGLVAVTLRRKRAEDDLRESEERFALFMQHLPCYAFIKDEQSRAIYLNPSFEKLSGMPLETALGLRATDHVPPEVAQRIEKEDQEIVRDGRVIAGLEREIGDRVFSTYKFPLPRQGLSPLIGGIMLDVTERRRAEEERRALERKVLQAQKLESLGVLAGGIAHDFNNLMTCVLGHASIGLADLPAGSPVKENLKQVQKAARCAANLTRQMLAYSGQGGYLVEAVGLSGLVQEMIAMLGSTIPTQARIVPELAEGLPTAEADPTQMRQLLLNLLTNAAEAVGPQHGEIRVSTGLQRLDKALLSRCVLGEALPVGDYLFVTVFDTGCGIPAEAQARIFEPFFTTKFTGRGLGLAAVLGIVRSHRGAILVESAAGQGSAFTVFLPPSARPVARAPPPPPAPTSWRGHGTILLADDEELVLLAAETILNHAGFQVLAAKDGREAIELFQRHGTEIRAAVLDVYMPRLDGAETARALRKLRPGLPIVLSSGHGERHATQYGPGLGEAGYAQKPYEAAELVGALRRQLERSGQHATDP